MRAATIAALLLAAAATALADDKNHRYAPGDPVTLWVNKVGPYNNPQQTFHYDTLPLCRPPTPGKPATRWGGLGEALGGDALVDGGLPLAFRVPVPPTPVCDQVLTAGDAAALTHAVTRHYWYEMFADDLPVWGFVGPPPAGGRDAGAPPADPGAPVHVYTHKAFHVAANGDRVIQVNLTNENPVAVAPGAALSLTYSVDWTDTDTPFGRRFDKYLDASFFEHQIHWFSVVNSAMMVAFLTGLVSAILVRTLRADYRRYAPSPGDDPESIDGDAGDETGWKLVHGDVFRAPPKHGLLCALVGTGAQLWVLAAVVAAAAAAGDLFADRGATTTVAVVAYALTAAVGGYVSGGMYARGGGKAWTRTALTTALLYPGTVLAIGAALNTVALAHRSLAAVPWGGVAGVLGLWLLLAVPLSLVGTVVGRNWAGAPDAPCRVKRIPSPVPPAPWWRRPAAVVAASGLLPFGSIFIETYFVFASFWNYKVYYVYGFAVLVLAILAAVTACVSVVSTYVLLASENHRWHWPSYLGAASTAVYVFGYAVHYYVAKTAMTGFFQTAWYFGYTLILALTLGTATGALGHLGAAAFVRRIYRNIKCD